METLFRTYNRLVQQIDCRHLRYLYSQIDWKDRLVGIKGARGVGKTTMMLQYIKLNFTDWTKALYVSLDHIWFSQHSLLELVEYHYIHGGTYLFLDEVHRYHNWSIELKNIYDSYPDMHIVFIGSSLLEIDYSIADLSRRCRLYQLRGLSFREYLFFEDVADFPVLPIEEILQGHVMTAARMTAEVKLLPYFEKYMEKGYYPFYKDSEDGYYARILQIVTTILENDIPAVENIEFESIQKIKRLLVILSEMVPFTLNVSTLCGTLSVSRNHLLKLLQLLERSALLYELFSPAKGLKQLVKPEKILFDNTNLMMALGNKTEVGTLRETFFANQVREIGVLQMPEEGDFLLDEQYLFEVGGKGKGFQQIRNKEDSFVVADGIEIGMGNKIPLWLFGFLY